MQSILSNLAELIERGGIVMIPLLILSVISVALIIERTWFWLAQNGAGGRRWFERSLDLLANGSVSATREALRKGRGLYADVTRETLAHGATDAAALRAVEQQRPRMERFMVALSTIITAAPLLGILGTVLGIIQSFDLLGQQETLTDPRAVSSGIAEALLTTALGLVVALMTLFPYMLFRGQLDRTVGRLETLVAAAGETARRDAASAETKHAHDRTTQGK